MNSTQTKEDKPVTEQKEQKITPYEVSASGGKIDYQKIVREFGCDEVTPELLKKWEQVTGL